MTDDLLKEQKNLSLQDICDQCNLSREVVVAYIEEGLIEVAGSTVSSWRFSEIHLLHIQKANRLERDLRLNPAGSVLVLELMQEIETLKNQIKRLHRQDDQEPDQ